MRRLLPSVRLLFFVALAAFAVPAHALEGDVYVRGTSEGLLVKVTDADRADCEVLRPSPQRVILVVRNLVLPTLALADRFELANSVRVVGPDVLGGNESRVIIELTSSALQPTLEEVGAGVVLTLRAPGDAPPPPPEPAPAPATEASEAPRTVTTPWRRSRQSVRSARQRYAEGAPAAAEEAEIDPADRERLARAEEQDERARRRAAREQRVAEHAALTPPEGAEAAPAQPPAAAPSESEPAATEAGAAPEPAEPAEPKAPPVRAKQKPAVQPSPATPVPSGMVRVAGGEFLQGTLNGEGFEDEEPQRAVDLDPFWIDAHEVTVGEFRRSPVRLPEQPSWNVGDDMPVVDVTWHEAAQYCEWAHKRLPTEAEWEKAARGEDARRYPWGDGWNPAFANSGAAGDGHDTTAPVGSYPDGASPSGALDMAGNAWEWTADWYEPDAYVRRDVTNPQGPSRGAHKVVRGGSFRGAYSVNVRSAIRMPLAPSQRHDDVGFRCASDPR